MYSPRFISPFFSPSWAPWSSPILAHLCPAKLRYRALLPQERERHNTADVHLWAIDVHVQLELLAHRLDVLQPLLVVRARAAHPDLDLVLDEHWCDLAQCLYHALERAGDVGEVCDAAADE